MVNRVKKMSRITGAIADTYHTLAGRKISKAVNRGVAQQIKAQTSMNPIPGFKTGGTVKKTGLIRAHKGEVVITASAAKALKKIMKK
jgi:hypothetical protein